MFLLPTPLPKTLVLHCGIEKHVQEEDRASFVSIFNWAIPALAPHSLAEYFCGRVSATQQIGSFCRERPLPFPIQSPLSFVRVRVSQDGQFLHYIFPYQFMDSPEWESLHPSEEGTFQVIRSPKAAQSPATVSPQHCYLSHPLSPICPLTATKSDARRGRDRGLCLLFEKSAWAPGSGEQGRVVLVPDRQISHGSTTLPKD